MGPQEVLREDARRARAAAEQVGVARVRKLLRRAQLDLARRLREAEGLRGPGADSFTASRARLVLAQVTRALAQLKPGMREQIVGDTRGRAEVSAKGVLAYLRAAERQFTGVAQPLVIPQALVVDRAVTGAESSVLRRILSDPAHPGRPGVLDRYGEAVVSQFEDSLQQRVLAQKPWAEVRDELVAASPFLQGAPAHWAERIVRTESMHAANAGAHGVIVEVARELPDMVKVLSCVFDARTGADSIAVHGQVRRSSEVFDTWFGPVMHPPDRPNDRGVVVPHRLAWPLPASLKPRSDAEVAARWRAEGRKGSPPSRPRMSTVELPAKSS